MIGRRVAAVCLFTAAAACGHPVYTPPKGPGTPVADAKSIWEAATAPCRGATTFTADLRVSGRAGDRRIWPLSIETAVTSASSIYMGATAAGRSIFVLAGNAQQATLWLKGDEERVVVAPPGAIVEAMLGVALPPDRLLAMLTGCITRSLELKSSEQIGRTVVVETADARVFLTQEGSAWRTRAGEIDGFLVEVVRDGSLLPGLPGSVFINTPVGRVPRADLDVRIREAEMNGTVPASVFTPPAGAKSAQPMTLEELRAAGPWKERGTPR